MSNAPGAWISLAVGQNESGVACTDAGIFVGEVPLLKRCCSACSGGGWQPRGLSDLNTDLSIRFGLPVDFANKIDGLHVVARALSEGKLARAQIATLNLQIPDPPDINKVEASVQETISLAIRLHASRLLKLDWNPEQHPRWPAGSADGVGGQFAPVDSIIIASDDGSLIPAQLDIPLDPVFPGPFDPSIPSVPKLGPFPSEILPPPIAIPNANPLKIPINPYPDRPECEEEWAAATKYCLERLRRGLMGRSARGIGRNVDECIRGQVTEDCGGNQIEY